MGPKIWEVVVFPELDMRYLSLMSVTILSTAADVIANPEAYLRALREGTAKAIPDLDYQAAAALADILAEEELLEEMVSYQKNVTGIGNTIFISPKGRTRHAARIKVAIDPPDAISPHGKTASIAINDGSWKAGEDVPPALLKEVQRFIELNRDVLIDYWEYRILSDELQRRLKSV